LKELRLDLRLSRGSIVLMGTGLTGLVGAMRARGSCSARAWTRRRTNHAGGR